jgi:lysophospholipase-2
MDSNSNIVTRLPTGKHTHTVIFLHSRDSEVAEFNSKGENLAVTFPNIKWIFPASRKRYSARFHTEISQWFDIWSVEDPSEKAEIQKGGLKESIMEIAAVVREEATIIPATHIILAGISQGCATAILVLLLGGTRLGGFVGLSSWLPFQSEISEIMNEIPTSTGRLQGLSELIGLTATSEIDEALKTAVFLSHSIDDDVIPIKNSLKLEEGLLRLGFSVDRKTYNEGGHWIYEPQGVDDIESFIRSCMGQ